MAYFMTGTVFNAGSGGGGSNMHTYSETEHEVGTWVDGNPVYEKTINTGNLPNKTTKTTAHGISHLDKVINVFGVAYSSTYNAHIPLPYMNVAGLSYCIGLYVSNTDIYTISNTDMSSYGNAYVTIQYTKSA